MGNRPLPTLPSQEGDELEKYDSDIKKTDVNTAEVHLTLEQAINRALQANRTIIRSQYSLESRQLSSTVAQSEFGLKFTPSVSSGLTNFGSSGLGFGVSLQKKFALGTSVKFGPRISRSDNGTNTIVMLSLSQPLLKGFGRDTNLDGIRSAEFSSRSAERTLYQTRVNTVTKTVTAVYDVIKQKELVNLYESLIIRLQGHAEVARAKENVGLSTPMDTYRAELKTKDAEDKFAQSISSYHDAVDKLKNVMDFQLGIAIDVYAPLKTESVDIALPDALAIALKNRVEIIQAEDEIKEAKRGVRIARRNNLPDLNLNINYTSFSSSFGSDTLGTGGIGDGSWGIGLESGNGTSRASRTAAYKQSMLNARSLKLQLVDTREDIMMQVRSSLFTLKQTEERIGIRKDQIIKAEAKQALAKIKFSHGIGNNFDLIEAETELQNARVNLLNVKIDYIINTYNIRAILGTLIDKEIAAYKKA